MALKANKMSVKNKTQPQDNLELTSLVETALFCLANDVLLLANFSTALTFWSFCVKTKGQL